MDPAFAITTPSATVALTENRIGSVVFTVTNTTDRSIEARFVPRALAGAPAEWFRVEGDQSGELEARAARQVIVTIEPPLGTPAGSCTFRLDAVGVQRPDEDSVEGPAVVASVPGSTAKLSAPRGYLATLVGATAGAMAGVLVVVVVALTSNESRSDCSEAVECVVSESIAGFVFWFFLLLLAFVLMLVGATVGSWIALRRKRYLGAKLTAVFLLIFMVPWAILMLATVFQAVNSAAAVAVLAPVVLVSLPAVIARGLVLLIRTKHI